MHDNPAYWDGFAGHALDAAVIDPNDRLGHKNTYISTLRNDAIIEAIPKCDDSLTVLDFGCGTGGLLAALAIEGLRTVGVDISMGLLKRCRDRQVEEQATIIRIDGHNLPLRDGSVDVVATYIVLMYITDELLIPLLREMKRILKPNGRIIIMEQLRRRTKMISAQGKVHRSVESFLKLAAQAGLRVDSVTVCRYGHFPLLYPIRFGLVPEKFFKPLQAFERRIGRLFGLLPWDYSDVRLVLGRSMDTSH